MIRQDLVYGAWTGREETETMGGSETEGRGVVGSAESYGRASHHHTTKGSFSDCFLRPRNYSMDPVHQNSLLKILTLTTIVVYHS